MDPLYLNMGLQTANLNSAGGIPTSSLSHINGLPQESKLATYIGNRQPTQVTGVQTALINQGQTLNSVNKTLAALSLERKLVSGLGKEFLSSSSAMQQPGTGLAHSSSTPSFQTSFASSAPNALPTFQNMNATANPLAAHNFPPLNNSFVSSAMISTSTATPMQYSTALRSSPSLSSSFVTRDNSPPQTQNTDRLMKNGSPSDVASIQQDIVGGTTYFYSAGSEYSNVTGSAELSASLNMSNQGSRNGDVSSILTNSSFHMAPPTPAHIHHLRTPTNAPHFFIQDELKKHLLEKQTMAMSNVTPDMLPDLPREVEMYHDLVPQEHPNQRHKSNIFGYITSVYKATHNKTGIQYSLYRIHNYKLTNSNVVEITNMWKKLQHSSLVQLREFFTTKDFKDNSIIFVYDYHAGSQSLSSKFNCSTPLQPNWENSILAPPSVNYTTETAQQGILTNGAMGGREMVSEAVLWNFIIQLTGALRVVHNANLACRMLDPSKVLITDNGSRLRINCCGILDVLNFDNNSENPMTVAPRNQQDDLNQLGSLILSVCVRGAVTSQKVESAMTLINRSYSRDLSMLIMYLITGTRIKNVNDIMPMIGARFYTAVECSNQRAEIFESELGKELHNGRLFRLITKLSTIVDRPHLNTDGNWSETGDRYMLKLFRDYLFYQTNEEGKPWLDLGHIVSVLNKLDSGSSDQILLMSHDGLNVLVTTYTEIKTCFLRSFKELMQAPVPK